MKDEQQQDEKTEIQINVDTAIEELEVLIPAQYSKLDKLNNLYKSTRQEHKSAILEEFWREGINFRELILFAFGILKKHHAQEDEGKPELYEKQMGDDAFETLGQAKMYRDLVLDLLHNYQERTESIDDEIEASQLLAQ